MPRYTRMPRTVRPTNEEDSIVADPDSEPNYRFYEAESGTTRQRSFLQHQRRAGNQAVMRAIGHVQRDTNSTSTPLTFVQDQIRNANIFQLHRLAQEIDRAQAQVGNTPVSRPVTLNTGSQTVTVSSESLESLHSLIQSRLTQTANHSAEQQQPQPQPRNQGQGQSEQGHQEQGPQLPNVAQRGRMTFGVNLNLALFLTDLQLGGQQIHDRDGNARPVTPEQMTQIRNQISQQINQMIERLDSSFAGLQSAFTHQTGLGRQLVVGQSAASRRRDRAIMGVLGLNPDNPSAGSMFHPDPDRTRYQQTYGEVAPSPLQAIFNATHRDMVNTMQNTTPVILRMLGEARSALGNNHFARALRLVHDAAEHIDSMRVDFYNSIDPENENGMATAQSVLTGLEFVRDTSGALFNVLAGVAVPGIGGAVLGAGYQALQNLAQQGVEMNVGIRQQMDIMGPLANFTFGAVLGYVGNEAAARVLSGFVTRTVRTAVGQVTQETVSRPVLETIVNTVVGRLGGLGQTYLVDLVNRESPATIDQHLGDQLSVRSVVIEILTQRGGIHVRDHASTPTAH